MATSQERHPRAKKIPRILLRRPAAFTCRCPEAREQSARSRKTGADSAPRPRQLWPPPPPSGPTTG
eukprot:8399797-Lingulodinium_polyedra.AAC.1